MTKTKLIILFSFLSIILTGVSWVYAQTSTLEVNYPVFSNAPDPSLLNFLPNYIKYIYVFVVIAGGLIAFAVLVMAGFRYLTSAGNPSVMSDARNQIFSALIGLVILLGSYVFLNEINPETLTIEPPEIVASGQGIIVYSDQDCGDGSNALPGVMKPLDAGIRFLRVETTTSVGEKDFGTDAFSVGSFYTFNSQEDFTIEFYGNKDCETGWLKTVPNSSLQTFGARSCVDHGSLGGTINNVKCIKIIWHKPGVYLYSYPNSKHSQSGNPEERVPPGECFEIYQSTTGSLPDCLNDKVGSIALVDDTKTKVKYGVVLRNMAKELFGQEPSGWAHVYIPKKGEEVTLYNTYRTSWNNDGKDVGSITVFQVNEDAIESSIQICRNADCLGPEEESAVPVVFDWGGGWEREEVDKSVSSGSDGLKGLDNLNIGYKDDIAMGVRFINDTGDDFDGKWSKDDNVIKNAMAPYGNSGKDNAGGITAIKFLRNNSTYLGILYDRADATTDTKWQEDGVLHPGGRALLIGTSKPALQQLEFDNCTGSLLLIKAKMQ